MRTIAPYSRFAATLIASLAIFAIHVQATYALPGIIPGTLTKQTSTSPGRDCLSGNAGSWPVYSCQVTGCDRWSSCAHPNCGIQSYNSCATPACGIQSYNTCTTWNCWSHWVACTWSGCTGGSWAPNTCADSSCWVAAYNSCPNSACWVAAYNTCVNSVCWCADDHIVPVQVNTINLSYTANNENQQYSFPQLNVTPNNQLTNYCSVSAYRTTAGAANTGIWYVAPSSSTLTCQDGVATTYAWGQSGWCVFRSDNYYIDSYNQLVGVLPPPGGSHRTSLPSTSTYDATNASCTVDGLVGQPDTPPVPTFAGSVDQSDTNAIFASGDHWCNVTKYRDSMGTLSNPFTPGCLYYSQKVGGGPTATPKNPDLFKGLNFQVSNTAGIYSVKVEIGSKCSRTFTFTNNKNAVLVNPVTWGWVKSAFQTLNVSYSGATPFHFGDASYSQDVPNLLNMFGKPRLDECLGEGKNFVQVEVITLGQSTANGTMDQGTTGTGFFSKYVNVDESAPKLGVDADAKKVASTNVTNLACFGNGPVTQESSDTEWKNFTLDGKLLSGDPFGNDAVDCSPKCTQFTQTGRTCSGTTSPGPDGVPAPKPTGTGIAWLAPAGVNPTTGAFTGMICDGLGPIPDVPSCAWGCSQAGYIYDSVTHACVKSTFLFILFDEGTPNAAWPYAAKLYNDETRSHGLLKSKSGSCATPASASSAIRFIDFTFLDGANYQFPPEIETYPIQEIGSGSCVPTCWDNTHTDWSTTPASCTGNSHAANCAPAPSPRGAMWAGTGWIYQTFNATSATAGTWLPPLPATTYNSGAVSSACDYKCRNGYAWSGSISQCVALQAAPLAVGQNICRGEWLAPCVTEWDVCPFQDDINQMYLDLFGRCVEPAGHAFFASHPTFIAATNSCKYKLIEEATSGDATNNDCTNYQSRFGHAAPSATCWVTAPSFPSGYSPYSAACWVAPAPSGVCTAGGANMCTVAAATGAPPWGTVRKYEFVGNATNGSVMGEIYSWTGALVCSAGPNPVAHSNPACAYSIDYHSWLAPRNFPDDGNEPDYNGTSCTTPGTFTTSCSAPGCPAWVAMKWYKCVEN